MQSTMISNAFIDMSRQLCFFRRLHEILLHCYFHGDFVSWVCIFNGMNHPKDGIFDLQSWRYCQQILSNPNRCLGCSASLLKASFMPPILQLRCLWSCEWKNVESLWSRAENFSNVYFLELEAYGLFPAQACFIQGFPNLLLTIEEAEAVLPRNIYTYIHIWDETFAYHTGSTFCFPVVYLPLRDMWSLVWGPQF